MWLTKYNASGNDFLITTAFKRANRALLAKKLCDRFSGIGADGLVVLLPHERFAYQWEFYNSDGSAAKMCGNASRAVAHYAYHNKIAPKNHSFLSGAGEIKVSVSKNVVAVNLGIVRVVRENIVELGLDFTLLDSGVPHLVAFVREIEVLKTPDLGALGALREKYNANVNLAFIHERGKISLLTYERGVEGVTLACGTGMCAVFALGLSQNLIDNNATLIPPSGDKLLLSERDSCVHFKGAVQKVAEIFV